MQTQRQTKNIHRLCVRYSPRIGIAHTKKSQMSWGRQPWKPQCFGKHRVPDRKPAADRTSAVSRASRRKPKSARAARMTPAPPPLAPTPLAPTLAAYSACGGLLLFAYVAVVFGRFCRACLMDALVVGARHALRWTA